MDHERKSLFKGLQIAKVKISNSEKGETSDKKQKLRFNRCQDLEEG